jgi:hypothetical protein
MLRNIAVLAALQYVAIKSDNTFILTLYRVSVGIFSWLALWYFIALGHVVFVFAAASGPTVRIIRLLQWLILFVIFYASVQNLVGYIVDQVVSAQYSLPHQYPPLED